MWIVYKGGKTKKHLEDIKRKRKDINGNLQREKLNEILRYASSEIPFYKNIDASNIQNFPVMNKSIYNENKTAVINSKYDVSKLHFTSTSGSSGVPFKTYQDSNKVKRNRADLLSLFSDFGFEVGEKYVFIRSWVSLYKLSKYKMLKQNFIAVDVNTFDETKKEELRQLLRKDRKIKAIISYGSALTDFVDYLEKKGEDFSNLNLKFISSSSDALKIETKKKLEKMFDCPVTNRYSNEECGIMGNSKAGTTVITLNTSSYYFELLALESDTPVKAGEIGRIVVTDLYNKAMPIIRYDLGDLGISSEEGNCIKHLVSLEGRMDDVIHNDKGIVISAATLSTYMQAYDYVERYQLVENKDDSLTLLIVSPKDDFDELLSQLKKIFGEKRHIAIKKVEEIEREKTGKYKEIKVIK